MTPRDRRFRVRVAIPISPRRVARIMLAIVGLLLTASLAGNLLMAALDIGLTRLRLPVAWLGSTMTGTLRKAANRVISDIKPAETTPFA